MTSTAGIPLRVLHVEDYEDDSVLLHRCLTRAGYQVTLKRVETAEELREALASQEWDVVVTDHVLPGFSAAAARTIVQEQAPHLPVVFLSGAMGEEAAAVASMQAGIQHYALKNSLGRLVHGIPLIAGVVPREEQARVHLLLGNEYVRRSEPDLARGMYHFEEALRLAQQDEERTDALMGMGYCYVQIGEYRQALELMKRYAAARRRLSPDQRSSEGEAHYQLGLALAKLNEPEKARRAFLRAEQCFVREGALARVTDCRQRLREMAGGPQAASDWASCLARGRYHLMLGETEAAVTEGQRGLDLAAGDPVGTFQCCMLLMNCAEQEKDGIRAFAYAVGARVSAMEAGRLDLAYAATEALGELVRSLGPDLKAAVEYLERTWQCPRVNFWDYMPFGMLELRTEKLEE